MFVNGKEIYKFTAKDSEIIPYELCLKNISKGWSVDDMKKTGLKGCVYDFKVDHDSIFVSGITDIHKYLMKKKKKGKYKMFNFIKQILNVFWFIICESVTIKNVKYDLKLLLLIVMGLYFILLVSRQVNVVVVATILMIPMQNCVFLMLLKI